MNRNNYPDWFQGFWTRLQEARKIGPMRSLGGKGEAYQQCKTKKVIADDVDYLVNQYIKQRDGIISSWSRGGRPAPLKDICRWIKYERFDDEPCESSAGQTPSRSDRAAAAVDAAFGSDPDKVGTAEGGIQEVDQLRIDGA